MALVKRASSAEAAATSGAPEQVGPRLKRLRDQRRITLTALASTTGISKSTLSRLETGQRRPTLELLLALSQAYRVPLDDLVAAPDVGDPRIRLRPDRVKGRIVIPLTRQPEGMQGRSSSRPTRSSPSRAPTTGMSGSTCCPAACDSFSETRTGCSGPARSPSSTPRCRTGSAAPAMDPRRS